MQTAHRTIQDLASADLPFSERVREVMRQIKAIIPAETVNIGTIDFVSRQGSYTALNGFLMPPGRRALLPRFLGEHPMLNAAAKQRERQPLRFTDFYSRRQVEELPIYRECYRGYTHSMMTFNVRAASGVNVSFVLSRDSRDFTDHERDALSLLQPIVMLFMENALLRAALDLGIPPEGGILLGSGTAVQHLNPVAELLLREFFPGAPLQQLPDALATQVRQADQSIGLTVRKGVGALMNVKFSGCFSAWAIGLTATRLEKSRSNLTRRGLTGREIEILDWVEQGKTNAAIGIILGISPRTVEKHLERVFAKLGVESRQAAARSFRELTAS